MPIRLVRLACIYLIFFSLPASAQLKTKNVVLIVSDGLRWQEVFTGADPTLLNSEHGGSWQSAEKLRAKFWSDDVGKRRQLLFPFLWGKVASHGQLFGNQEKGSVAQVTNGMAFSYPGYNEMLTGIPDPRINSNEFGPNPNVSVFEWLDHSPELRGRVEVFATWHTFAEIFNRERSHLPMQVGWDAYHNDTNSLEITILNQLLKATTPLDEEDLTNSYLQVELLDRLKSHRPRALFVGYGETDNWAHSGRYDLVLESALRFDHFVQELWNTMQSLPEYRDKTTFIITTDHGRGSGLNQWKEHGVDQTGSENIWLAVIGPDTAPLGERTNTATITQSQIAATVAAFMAMDYRKDTPRAAPPLYDVVGSNPTPAK